MSRKANGRGNGARWTHLMTLAALEAIDHADALAGGKRHLGAVSGVWRRTIYVGAILARCCPRLPPVGIKRDRGVISGRSASAGCINTARWRILVSNRFALSPHQRRTASAHRPNDGEWPWLTSSHGRCVSFEHSWRTIAKWRWSRDARRRVARNRQAGSWSRAR